MGFMAISVHGQQYMLTRQLNLFVQKLMEKSADNDQVLSLEPENVTNPQINNKSLRMVPIILSVNNIYKHLQRSQKVNFLLFQPPTQLS